MEIVRSVGVTALVALMSAHRAMAQRKCLIMNYDEACNRLSANREIARSLNGSIPRAQSSEPSRGSSVSTTDHPASTAVATCEPSQ